MRRASRPAALLASALLLTACQGDDEVGPFRDSATVSETLPEDAGDLENPAEVTSPGGGSGETEES